LDKRHNALEALADFVATYAKENGIRLRDSDKKYEVLCSWPPMFHIHGYGLNLFEEMALAAEMGIGLRQAIKQIVNFSHKRVTETIGTMKTLSKVQRLEIMATFCPRCGAEEGDDNDYKCDCEPIHWD
jgi:hypothetical protein